MRVDVDKIREAKSFDVFQAQHEDRTKKYRTYISPPRNARKCRCCSAGPAALLSPPLFAVLLTFAATNHLIAHWTPAGAPSSSNPRRERLGPSWFLVRPREFSGEYKRSSSLEKTVEQKIEYEVIVPPMTKVTVSLIASKGSCDVSFSYKQEDIMYDGRVVIYDMDDGMYTGTNCYDFEFERKRIFE
ncbi:hypothetical protein GUJ93_ZPchr0173g47696 [Zizania palustris]|uniref:Uncharacterized protein n=1 Tax=Zizania palustris TaxID=103762 RepID=A0A8J5VRE4_ZIZPA|nr:hypothetical protein GUJ93_ZPchr0173g47696 [Zizania palustris]